MSCKLLPLLSPSCSLPFAGPPRAPAGWLPACASGSGHFTAEHHSKAEPHLPDVLFSGVPKPELQSHTFALTCHTCAMPAGTLAPVTQAW